MNKRNRKNLMRTKYSFLSSITDTFVYKLLKEDSDIIINLIYTTKTQSSRYIIFHKNEKQFEIRFSTHKQKIYKHDLDFEFIIDNKDELFDVDKAVRFVLFELSKL